MKTVDAKFSEAFPVAIACADESIFLHIIIFYVFSQLESFI